MSDDTNDIWEKGSLDQGDGENKKAKSAKPKRSKKEDLLAGAAREEMSGFSLMGDFINEGQPDEPDDESVEPEEFDEPEAIIEDEDETEKKELSDETDKLKLSQMEEERLRKIDPAELEEKSFEFEDGSSKIKAIVGVVAISLALTAGYFLFMGGETQPKVLLSTGSISESNYKQIKETGGVYPIDKRIYVFFVTGGRLGVRQVHIKIIEEIKKPGNKVDTVLIGQSQRTVNPNWRSFSTHFQREYFDHAGSYKVQIVSPSGKMLAENRFVIKAAK